MTRQLARLARYTTRCDLASCGVFEVIEADAVQDEKYLYTGVLEGRVIDGTKTEWYTSDLVGKNRTYCSREHALADVDAHIKREVRKLDA